MPLKILILEPYYGGSHKSFLSGLEKLPFQFEFMSLPARKWKWRMRLSGPYYADKLKELDRKFDLIICSTFVDVASFRGLGPRWVREVPMLTYFHENQFEYPTQVNEERDMHFALTNMTTALASDSLAFNSAYNLETFLEGIDKLLRKSYDMKLDNASALIRERSRVLPPGIDFAAIDAAKGPERDGPPVIVWNHRWEHDKNPGIFFNALLGLDREGVDFRLVVLGESFREHPPIFDEALKKLSSRVLYSGYAESRDEYAGWLKQGDIIISTAGHEFFGMAIIEAVRAGCLPLLPRRLSYPELFPGEFLYEEKDFVSRLKECILTGKSLSNERAMELTSDFSWDSLGPAYKSWIMDALVR
jgi:glycosyltransferase involved in cell wall biosynthesis